MHRRFCIGLPKLHIRFCIGPPETVLALLNIYWPSWICIVPPESVMSLLNPYWPSWILNGPPEMHRWGILMYPFYYERKALKKPIWKRMADLGISWFILFDLGWYWLIFNDLEWSWLISIDWNYQIVDPSRVFMSWTIPEIFHFIPFKNADSS